MMSSRRFGAGGHFDDRGRWVRTKNCLIPCGDRCDCVPPNGQYYSKAHDKRLKEPATDNSDAQSWRVCGQCGGKGYCITPAMVCAAACASRQRRASVAELMEPMEQVPVLFWLNSMGEDADGVHGYFKGSSYWSADNDHAWAPADVWRWVYRDHAGGAVVPRVTPGSARRLGADPRMPLMVQQWPSLDALKLQGPLVGED